MNIFNFFKKKSKHVVTAENVIKELNAYADIFKKIDDPLLALNCNKNLVKDQYYKLLEKSNIQFENGVANSIRFNHILVWPNVIEGGVFKINATYITSFNKESNSIRSQLISFSEIYVSELNSFIDFLKTYGSYKDYTPNPKRFGPDRETTLISLDKKYEISSDDPYTSIGSNRNIRIILL